MCVATKACESQERKHLPAMVLTTTFTLPFERRDVWYELTSAQRQLGLDASVMTTVLEKGKGQPSNSNALAVGMVRMVQIPGEGATTSKLVQLNAEQGIMVWEVVAQHDCRYTLKAGSRDPIAISIRLEHQHAIELAFSPARPVGTIVTLTYECAGFIAPGCLGWWFAQREMERGLAQIGPVWHNDLLSRGYKLMPPR